MIERNAGVSAERRIEFRIGIHLGDIVEESDGDLMGDGINIAARLEGVAAPGAVCLSDDAYRQVKSRLTVTVSDLGETRLKNIADPMRIYSLDVDTERDPRPPSQSRSVSTPTASSMNYKPSIAVLPFVNMSGDADQQYFSDGITEDVITELSRFRSLMVIARNSSFQFRGSSVDHAEVQRKLGVRYIVTGTIRRLADNIRITVELIDAQSGSQLWTDRFDRAWQEIFSVQDELVRSIVGTIEGRVVTSGAEEAQRKHVSNRTAYDLVLQAREYWNRYDAEGAEAPLRKALELEPNYSAAHAWLGLSLFLQWAGGPPNDALGQDALSHTMTAVKLDPDTSLNHWALAHVLLFHRRYNEASLHYERALELNPNDCMGRTCYAHFLQYTGKPDEALSQLQTVRQRDPYPPLWYWEIFGSTLYQLRRYDEAVSAYHKMDRAHYWVHNYLAASYAMAGRLEDARRELDDAAAISPLETLNDWARTEPYQHSTNLNHLLDGLRRAGMSD
jgi:TolB-like protein/Flp pilus assembly protein TadD